MSFAKSLLTLACSLEISLNFEIETYSDNLNLIAARVGFNLFFSSRGDLSEQFNRKTGETLEARLRVKTKLKAKSTSPE